MCSLFAGSRKGIHKYQEDSVIVGHHFYVPIIWSNNRLLKSAIVEVIEVEDGLVLVRGGKYGDTYKRSIADFLKAANNETDIYGNPRVASDCLVVNKQYDKYSIMKSLRGLIK